MKENYSFTSIINGINHATDLYFVIAVDIGTSETKASLISENGLVDSAMSRNDLIYINQTWIEQDPAQIKNGIIKT
ncbi:MAG: hypothetical protein ACTSXF_00665, partial [Promethearchaeota archaeon]